MFSTLQSHFHKQTVASISLLCCYFLGRYSGELNPFLSIVDAFMVRTRPANTLSWIIFIWFLFHLWEARSMLPQNNALCNKLLRWCFLNRYNLKLLKSEVNCYLSYIPSNYVQFVTPTIRFYKKVFVTLNFGAFYSVNYSTKICRSIDGL